MKFFQFLSISSLLISPVSAQFGIPKKKKGGTSFEELNELMKEEQETGSAMNDLQKIQEMMAAAMEDPQTLKAVQAMQEGLLSAMEEMSNMNPEDVQQNMVEAMKLMTDGSILEAIVEKKDEVLANLEQTGMVPPEEIAKYRADPAYFEEQMRGAFDQMSGIFNDPELLQTAAESLKGLQDAYTDPIVTELRDLLLAKDVTDAQIEELRLKILASPDILSENSMLASMFEMEDFKDQVQDTKKWNEGFHEAKDALKEVLGDMGGVGGILGGLGGDGDGGEGAKSTGAGVGEL